MEMQGLFGITPELEAKGRKGDTEVGRISKGSVVLPVVLIQSEEGAELVSALNELYDAMDLDFSSFQVTPENTEYAIDLENAIEAHLTNGEIVIPPLVLNVDKEFEEAIKELFQELEINYDEFLVGHADNKINPATGLPEFFIKKLVKKITRPVRKVVKKVAKVVKKVVKKVVDPVVTLGKNILGGVEDAVKGVVDLADDAISNPYVRAVASFVFPKAAIYLNAYAKLDNGEKLTAGDIASLGLSATSNFTNFKIDPNIAKGIKASARIADGGNAVEVLAGEYGADFAKKLGLDTKVNEGLKSTFGDQTANFVSEYVDINQAAADLASGKAIEDIAVQQLGTDVLTFAGNKAIEGVGTTFGSDAQQFLADRMDINQAANDIIAGTDPYRLVANQFGDDIAEYIGGDDPNMQALGFAGVETAVGLGQGLDPADALMAGGKEYYERGGQLPDIGELAGITGADVSGFDWNRFLPEIDIEAPQLFAQGYDWLKGTGVDVNNWIEGRDWGELNLNIDQFADLGGDFSMPSFQGLDVNTDFGDYSLEELADLGIDLRQLNIGDLTLPQGLALAGVGQQIAGESLEEDEVVASLENPLMKIEDEGPLFSRQLLESAPIAKV